MTHSLLDEVRRVNLNFFLCNGLLLLAALGLAGLPSFMGYRISDGPLFLFCLISAAPFIGLSLWNLEKWLRRNQEPESHPFLEKIRSLGFGRLEAIDQDLNLDQARDFLRLTLGPTWLLRRGFFKLELALLEEAVWAYKRVSHAEYLMYSQAMVYLRSGKNICSELSSGSKKVEAFLEAISQNAPWVIMGENDDLAALWKKDRNGFVAQVDQRRKVLEAKKRGMVIS